MNFNEYSNALELELQKHSSSVIEKWRKVLSILPAETKELHVIISPGQDGEGIFDVFISLIGPDLYVLNKAIRDHFRLFTPKHTQNGIEPWIPTFDLFDDTLDIDFAVNDAVVDVVLPWLENLWPKVKTKEMNIPIGIYGDEGYGTRSSVQLA